MRRFSHQTLNIVRLAFREVRVGLLGKPALGLAGWEEKTYELGGREGGQSSADCLEHSMIPEKPLDQGTSPQGSPNTDDMAHSQCCNCCAGQHCSDSVLRTLAGPDTKKN